MSTSPVSTANVSQEPAGDRKASRGGPGLVRSVVGAKEFGGAVALVAMCVIFTILSDHFLTAATFSNIAVVTAQYGIIAVGVTILMIAGEFDLTTGALFALAPMCMAHMYIQQHWPLLLAFITALVISALLGLINGLLTVVLRIPSFIVTLGMMFWWIGLLIGVTNGLPIALSTPPPPLLNAMGGALGSGNTIYAPVIWYFVILVAGIYALEFTTWGNKVFAAGSNATAAKAMGVPVGRIKIGCFVLSALLAGLSGCLIFGYQLSAQPTQGNDFELYAIVAAVVGGTSLFGGTGSVAGSLIGSLIIAISGSGLVLIGAPSAWYEAFVGLILIIAVCVNLRVTGSKLRSLIGIQR